MTKSRKKFDAAFKPGCPGGAARGRDGAELRSGTAFTRTRSMAGRSRLWTRGEPFSRGGAALWWMAEEEHERETAKLYTKYWPVDGLKGILARRPAMSVPERRAMVERLRGICRFAGNVRC